MKNPKETNESILRIDVAYSKWLKDLEKLFSDGKTAKKIINLLIKK